MKPKRSGFTLIELLIVVAIIAILAAIAVPNFLEAQVRSKVSRVKSDLRTVATAVESYTVDNNRVPRMVYTSRYAEDLIDFPAGQYPGGVYGIIWKGLSTPIAYITQVGYIDPFKTTDSASRYDERVYTYQDLSAYEEWFPTSTFWPEALLFYGKWRLGSVGPDKEFSHGFTNSAQLAYDPTNGTVSQGNIWRSQNRTDNEQPEVGPLLGNH